MKLWKLFTPVAATLLNAAALAFMPVAIGAENLQTAGGVPYASGGVGQTSIDRLTAITGDFNLKLVFALKSGDYVSGVNVTIADAAGKPLLDTTSEGPWFLTRLPVGSYQIVATLGGKAEKRSIAVGTEKLRTVDFRWGSE